MYGAVPLRSIKKALFESQAKGGWIARMLVLTNCTFDGHIYNTSVSWRSAWRSSPT